MSELDRPIPGLPQPSTLLGIHHISLPVSDILRSRDWYVDVLGFQAVLDYEEEDRLIGVVLELPTKQVVHLHLEPQVAVAVKGFTILTLGVKDRDGLENWCERFADLGVEHTGIVMGHTGWLLRVTDPDGIQVQLHTPGQPTAD